MRDAVQGAPSAAALAKPQENAAAEYHLGIVGGTRLRVDARLECRHGEIGRGIEVRGGRVRTKPPEEVAVEAVLLMVGHTRPVAIEPIERRCQRKVVERPACGPARHNALVGDDLTRFDDQVERHESASRHSRRWAAAVGLAPRLCPCSCPACTANWRRRRRPAPPAHQG